MVEGLVFKDWGLGKVAMKMDFLKGITWGSGMEIWGLRILGFGDIGSVGSFWRSGYEG